MSQSFASAPYSDARFDFGFSRREGARIEFDWARFCRQFAALTGVALDAGKFRLAQARLAPVLRAHGLSNLAQLVDKIEGGENKSLAQDVVEAMTTQETQFFRDRSPFDYFRTRILPELIAARANERRLRIWCAACSTGQEAYSLAMTLDDEARAMRGWTLETLATDLSAPAIESARAGRYSQFEVQRGLSTSQLLRYFHRDGDGWRVNEHLRARIDFREFNLVSDYAEFGTFDVIFCRNVLSAFGPEMKRSALARLRRSLSEGGYLVLGAEEPVSEANAHFAQVTHDGVWRARRRAPPRLRLA